MDNNPDKHFFDLFMMVMGSLVAVALGLLLLSNYIASRTQEVYILEDPVYQQVVADRIAPVSRVALNGEATGTSVKTVKSAPATEPLSGQQVYEQACMACHGAGIAGAPAFGDADAWGPRISQGIETLREHAINGYQGSTGFMPPRGGRADLSDDEIFAAMDYLIEQAR